MTNIRYIVSSHSEEEKKASSDLISECFDKAMGIAYEKRYNWQFLENPAGNGTIIMAYDGHKAVGQIASIPCRYMFIDRDIQTAIAGEWLCVSPKYRGLGIMSDLLRHRDENSFPFLVDLPNHAAMKGFVKMGYRQTSMKLLTRPLKLSKTFVYKKIPRIILRPFDGIWKKQVEPGSSNATLEEYSQLKFDRRFDEFLDYASTKNYIRQVRNSEFLNWRYTNVPGRTYKTVISTGQDGSLYGYVIIRIANAYGINVGFIIDLVAKQDEPEVEKDLIQFALAYFWNNNVAVGSSIVFSELHGVPFTQK